MDYLKALPIKEVIGAIVTFVSLVFAWYEKNKEKIQAVILRIEKDSQDDWTNEEKENLAIELFFQEIYPTLPFYIRIIPKSIIEKQIKKIIKSLCAKSHELKDKVTK